MATRATPSVDEHALKAFDAAALDYLVKPITKDRLQKALQRLRRAKTPRLDEVLGRLEATRGVKRAAFKSGARYVVLETSEVAAIVAEDHYWVIKGPAEELLSDEILDQLLARLSPSFLRAHRGAIINLDRVRSLDREGDRKYFAIMSTREPLRIPVSRERLAALKAALAIPGKDC